MWELKSINLSTTNQALEVKNHQIDLSSPEQFQNIRRYSLDSEFTNGFLSVNEINNDTYYLNFYTEIKNINFTIDRYFHPNKIMQLSFDLDLDEFIAFYNTSDWWIRPFFNNKFDYIPNRCVFLLGRKGDKYICLLPITHNQIRSEFFANGNLTLNISNFNFGEVRVKGTPLLIHICNNPYTAIEETFEILKNMNVVTFDLRKNKSFPKSLEYLGWCTWDALYYDVNQDFIFQQLEYCRKHNFQFGFILIDDGWLDSKDGKLYSFNENRVKFPLGFKDFIKSVKDEYKINYVGLWHAFTGYWNGIHPESPLIHELNLELVNSKLGMLLPLPNENIENDFYYKWYEYLKNQGIDFVKVDNQGTLYHFAKNVISPFSLSQKLHNSLENSAEKHFEGQLINCMAMQPDHYFNWNKSAVSRASDDFFPKREKSYMEHARQNIYNSLWVGNIVWPDFDMWWTSLDNADFYQALRAISGGPVYVSDPVEKIDFEKLKPLAFSDGKILRCDRPPLPTKDCIFLDTSSTPYALKAFNFVDNIGVLGAFNVYEEYKDVCAEISPNDIEGIQGDKFLVREFYTKKRRLMDRNEKLDITLPPKKAYIFLVIPYDNSFIPIGLEDKILAPKSIVKKIYNETSIFIKVYEKGKFIAYSLDRPKKITDLNNNEIDFSYQEQWVSVDLTKYSIREFVVWF